MQKSYNSEPYQRVSDLEDMRYPDEELSGGEWLKVTRKKHKRISIQRGKVSLTTPPGPLFRKPLTRSRSLLLQQIFNQGKYVVGIFGGLTKPLKQKCVQSLIKTHNLDMICLLESKMEVVALNKALKLRFNGMSCLHNLFSPKIRVILLWNNSVAAVNLIDMTDQLIHVKLIVLVH